MDIADFNYFSLSNIFSVAIYQFSPPGSGSAFLMRTRIQDGKGMLIPADPDPQACFLHFHLVFSTVLTRLGTGKKKDAAFLLLEIRFGRDSIRSLTKAIFQKFQDDRYHI